jgi:uroporphyrinogen-III synthase
MRLLVTRPLDEAQELAGRLAARGHAPLVEPLLTISPDLLAALPLDGVRGLLFTSANGVRAFALRSHRRDLPVHAVGAATAAAAREVGFASVETADGDVEALAALVARRCRPDDGPLLHVAGKVTAGDLAGRLTALGFEVRRAILYHAEPLTRLSDETRDAIADGGLDGVLLFSPRTAATFVGLMERQGLRGPAGRLVLFALSPAVAEAARSLAWRKVVVAPAPTEAALLDVVDRTAQEESASAEIAGARPGGTTAEGVSGMDQDSEMRDRATANRSLGATGGVSRGWWLPIATVGVVAVVSLVLEWQTLQFLQGDDSRNAAADTTARLERVERAIDGLAPIATQTQAIAQRTGEVERAVAAMGRALEGINTRLQALDQGVRQELSRPREPQGVDPAALAAAVGENQRLAAEVQRLREEMARLVQLRDGARQSEQLAQAIAALRAALAEGRGHGVELGALRALAGGDPRIAPALMRVEAATAAGAPTHAQLRERFAAVATAAVLEARHAEDDPSWWRPIADRLTALVAVRRVGDVAGDDVEAVLARAEHRLAQGDLAGAVAGVEAVQGPAAAILAPWLAQARSRLALDGALDALTRSAAGG